MEHQKAFNQLIGSFRKLPGVGAKSAERMAFYVLDMDAVDVDEFIEALRNVRKTVSKCPTCGILASDGLCPICQDERRNGSLITVVQTVRDVYTIERTQEYNGRYHVLNGVIGPGASAALAEAAIRTLISRITPEVKEVIIATNPTIEGETTALYIKKMLQSYPITVTRLAYGLPVGGHLDYADDLTIARAFAGRQKI